MEHEFMRQAIAKTRAGIDAGQTPFGAAIVRNGRLLALAHNTVWRDCDPTAHAEVNAIREAARKLNNIDLSGCVMYATCEPCPMCLSAIHWSRISRVVFGASIADAADAGFNELRVEAAALVRLGGSSLEVEGGLLGGECRELFSVWKRGRAAKAY